MGYKALKPANASLKWNFQCGMFNPRIGQDIKTASMKLGDIVPSDSWIPGDDELKTLTRNCGIGARYTYVTEEVSNDMKEYEITLPVGWYKYEDFNKIAEGEVADATELLQNDVALSMTQGFTLQVSSSSTTVVMAGEVLGEDQPVSFISSLAWNFTGNYSPADIQLGDVTPSKSWIPGDDEVKMFSANFGVAARYTYVTEEVSQDLAEYELTIPVGWYSYADFLRIAEGEVEDSTELLKNDVKIAAGQAFSAQVSLQETTLTIPSALPAATQD